MAEDTLASLRAATRDHILFTRADLVARVEAPFPDVDPVRNALAAFDADTEPGEPDLVARELAREWIEVDGELDRIASALLELDRQIPPDIGWIIRVDGHTDARPIATAQFPSNWSLSAARAIAVVQALIARGVPAQRLAATGFGENQPLDPGTTEEAYARNRRIELKLTER